MKARFLRPLFHTLLGFSSLSSLLALEIRNDDRLIFLGSTIIEREQQHGYLETGITLAAGDKALSFRNLGWSGDTVFGHARSYFGPPEEGFERLTKHLEDLKPNVLILCYGADQAFMDESTDETFLAGYSKLIAMARSQNPDLRIAIISPPPAENLASPLPNLDQANARLAQLSVKLREFAEAQQAHFVDSFALMGGGSAAPSEHPITNNGLHYADAGYQIWAEKVVEGLSLTPSELTPEQTANLRQTIILKDQHFFNRWRPANETYLYGFRKHEQGQNAAEVEQFDPMVEEADKQIHQLKLNLLKP